MPHIVSKPREIQGAQTAQRALQILKLLGRHHALGLGVREIGDAMGADRSAVQRALGGLMAEGLVERDASRRRYHLGIEALHLGRATLQQSPLTSAYHVALQQIARTTGHTVFLGQRLGDFVLCIYRAEGALPERVFPSRVGDLRSLGVTAGGMALLAHLSDDEIGGLHARRKRDYDSAGLDLAALRRAAAQTRRVGYAISRDTVAGGVTGVGISLARNGEAFASLSVGGLNPRMDAERLASLHRALADTVRKTMPASLEPPPSDGPEELRTN